MRIPKSWVPLIARRIVNTMLDDELVSADVDREALLRETARLITTELEVEDRLNNDVREILKQYEGDIERGRMDYRTLFDLTKKKLIRERDIIV